MPDAGCMTFSCRAVQQLLRTGPGVYVNNVAADKTFGKVPAIPYLFEFVRSEGWPSQFPTLVEALEAHPNADCSDFRLARQRATKLAQDFLRDAHSFTILGYHAALVQYEGSADMAGVDFVVDLCRGEKSSRVKLQLQTRRVEEDEWHPAKVERRERRGEAAHSVHVVQTTKAHCSVVAGVWLPTSRTLHQALQDIADLEGFGILWHSAART